MVRMEVTYVDGRFVAYPHVDETTVERKDNMIVIGKFGGHEHSAYVNFNNVLFVEVSEE